MSKQDPQRFLKYLEAERKASMLYRSLAEASDGERREALLELADIEDEHAAHWVAKLEEYVRGSVVVLAFISKGYFLSANCQRELKAAIDADPES